MIYLTGFFLGLMGSLHCIGMCGPIALALPVPPQLNRGFAVLLYNIGRITSYAVIGLCFGFVGKLFILAGYQQILSIACGIVVICLSVYSTRLKFSPAFSRITSGFKAKFKSLVQKRGIAPFIILGMMNGLLPCGLVYISLAAATATGGPWNGALFMAFFGLGTVPVMFAIGYSHQFFSLPWRQHIKNYMTGLVFFTGVLLILRGLNLGIPYISPEVQGSNIQPVLYKCH
ncbi:MAG: sulfite exporter TauE/SafE family protein [Opitutaceae bacterium]|nr:sulfite exporter TauE/SafE family protein [Cytophagales bacterium]